MYAIRSYYEYRLLAETAREIILLFDANLRISYANTAWKRISGYQLLEMIDMTITEMIPSDQQQSFQAKVALINNDQPEDYLLETTFILKDGRTITVEATFAKLETADQMSTFLMTARDIIV